MDDWVWEFRGFESTSGNRIVQTWFNDLIDEDRDAIVDTLLYLQAITDRPWPETSFDSLVGAGGISEIKIPEFRSERNGVVKRITLRIYGFFGPPRHKHSYTFLHGKNKERRNDAQGKYIAKTRLDEVIAGTGNQSHKFNFG